MKIRERPEFQSKPAPFVLHADALADAAIEVMSKRNIGSVIIVDDDRKVAGIVTERDLLRRLLGENLDQHTTRLADIMTAEVRTAHQDDEVLDWMRLMSNERFRHLPVVDENGRLVNVLSQGDFVSYTWPQLLGTVREKAAETMRKPTAQVPILIGALMVYTLVMIVIFRLV